MNETQGFCVMYCEQPEALPSWKIAAVFCGGLVLAGIGFWLYRKFMECKNSGKGILHLNSLNLGYARKDEEYKGCMKYFYMFKYLSYYSFFVLTMSVLEHRVEGSVGLLARLEMWGICSMFFGVLISFFIWKGITSFCTRYENKKWVSDLRGRILKEGESFAFMMVSSKTRYGFFFRIAVYVGRFSSLSVMMATYFMLAYYFINLDFKGAIIATTIPVFIVLCDWVVFFAREDEVAYFKEQQVK